MHAAVISDVEMACRVAQPVEIAHNFVAQEGFPAGGEANEANDQLLAVYALDFTAVRARLQLY